MIRRTLTTLAGAAAATILLASPATAGEAERWDPRDDGRWDEFGEIWGTEVDYGKRLEVTGWFDHYADGHDFFVDTSGDSEPEFLLHWWTDDFGAEDSTYVTVYRMRNGEAGNPRCAPDTVTYDDDLPHQVRFTVRPRCLQIGGEVPAQLRIRTRAFVAAADSNPVDKARYTDWVSRG